MILTDPRLYENLASLSHVRFLCDEPPVVIAFFFQVLVLIVEFSISTALVLLPSYVNPSAWLS